MHMYMYLLHVLLAVTFISNTSTLKIVSSGYEDTPQFSTVISFFLMIEGNETNSTLVDPKKCCLYIEANDTDCNIMTLGNAKRVSKTGLVIFTFRNLYVRYRKGYCTFSVQVNGDGSPSDNITTDDYQSHVIPFDTFPDGYVKNCTGIDQDPDRQCTPVDCAIKYKGHRNYYNKTSGKCKPVAKCNTRGSDGVTVTAYYDWENNECIEYKWFKNENYLDLVESDTPIPASIDPSQTKYYPALEPQLLQNTSSTLQCNHGVQSGQHCVCDKGWISSGIHKDTPLVFHWCDHPVMTAGGLISRPPLKLTKPMEYLTIIVLCVVNLALCVLWMYLVVRMFCPGFLRRRKS